MPYKKILVAVDNSTFSLRAAKAGFELAHDLKAKLGLVFVIDKRKEIVNADLGITPDQSATVLLKQAEETIDQVIRTYEGMAEIFRFSPEGNPPEEIVRLAEEWDADLIVMGTHGRTGLLHRMTGSVTEYVIKHTVVPVLIVPSQAHS